MVNTYNLTKGILTEATLSVQNGFYDGASTIFNNDFFEVSFSLSIVFIGWLIAFKKLNSEETAYRLIWIIIIFTLVKSLINDKYYYDYLIELVNLPRDIFMEMVNELILDINPKADLGNVINTLSVTTSSLTSSIFEQGGWSNISAYFYGVLVWISGTFLLLVTILNSIFSIFLSDVVMSLLPIIIPTLILKKTEYVFYSWLKLYISLSLYAPLTLVFGLVSIEVVNMSLEVFEVAKNDFFNNIELIFSLLIMQVLCALGIMKIPNIINQLIGSANEGSSMTSGIGTISAGGAMVGAMAKYSGVSFAGTQIGKGASSLGRAGVKAGSDTLDKFKNRFKQ